MKLLQEPTQRQTYFMLVTKRKYDLKGQLLKLLGFSPEPIYEQKAPYPGRIEFDPVLIDTNGVHGILKIGEKRRVWYFVYDNKRYEIKGILPVEQIAETVFRCEIDSYEILPPEGICYHGQVQ